MIVCMVLAQVAIEIVEALLARQSTLRRPDITEAPLTNQSRFIPSLLQNGSNSDIPLLQGLRRWILLASIATNPSVSVMQPRHQHTA